MSESELDIVVQEIVSVETSLGYCSVVKGPWKDFGIGGEFPIRPHLLSVDQLSIYDDNGNETTNIEDISILLCHGHRPEKGALKTLEGHSVSQIVKALREKGGKS